MSNEDIFNKASYNLNSEEDKANFSKYPAYEILMNIHLEAVMKSNFCEVLLSEYRNILTLLLKDMGIKMIIAGDDDKYKAYNKFRKNIGEIIEKHMKLGDEFEAGLKE